MNFNLIPEPLAEAAKDFLQRVITPPLEEVGLLLADQVRAFRFRNQVTLAINAENYLKTKNIKTKKVSLKVLTPLLEGASMEEDESMQEKWVALLANTVNEAKNFENTVYSHILSQLTKTDAEMFELLLSVCTKTTKTSGKNFYIEASIIKPITISRENFSKLFKESNVSIDNLVRLRLIKEVVINEELPTLAITDLGVKFMEAISKD